MRIRDGPNSDTGSEIEKIRIREHCKKQYCTTLPRRYIYGFKSTFRKKNSQGTVFSYVVP